MEVSPNPLLDQFYEIHPSSVVCTCIDCEDQFTCEFAYDPYNTDGDCLAIK